MQQQAAPPPCPSRFILISFAILANTQLLSKQDWNTTGIE
jgi:hypothetical protein